jgi:C4-dicarboxylate transporter DctM subunit
MNAIGLMFIIFAVALFTGVPIGISICIVLLSAQFLIPGLTADSEYVFRSMVTALDTYPVLAVPLFVLCGIIMGRGGISKRLFDFFSFFIGNITGGLPMTIIVTCLFYGAISGSAPATTAAVGAMTIPLLVNLGYDRSFVTAIVATAGGLGIIIPPSIPFIWYGLTASVSVSDLFIAGVLPGILVAVFLCGYAYFYCKIKGEDKIKLSENYRALKAMGLAKMFKDSILALLMPLFVLGGIYGGVVTPTEAAVVAVVYSFIIATFVYKTVTVRDYPAVLREALVTVAPLMFVCGAAIVFGKELAMVGAPALVGALIKSTVSTKIGFLLIVNCVLIIAGMIIEPVSALLITTPILLPTAMYFGVDPIHLGVIIVVNLAIGCVTPPVGLNLYVASAMTGISIIEIAKKAVPLMVMFLLALAVITYCEWFSLALL